jgi:N-acetylneuraminate synthase/N,N'-diacetyllegionaminate synthase
MTFINIGSRKIGQGYPAYIVAEIGINHNADMDLAKKMILAAKESGADAVKFQNYKTEDFVPIKNVEFEYKSQGKLVKEFQYDMFKRYELSDENLVDLKSFSDANGIDFHSTPTNFQGVDLLKKIGVDVLKNGSDYLTNLDLVEYMGKSGLPTVLSTGMAVVGEIDDAVQKFQETGNKDLILLHCTSCYPTPPEDIHLAKIKTLRDTFGVISGFSDHSKGAWAAVGSVPYGAAWIEKHFTLDKNLPGPDHSFSCDPQELRQMVEGVRYIEQAMGFPKLGPTESEAISRKDYRLSCCAASDLEPGHIITKKDIIFTRPSHGLPPKLSDHMVGREVKNNIEAFSLLNFKDVA